MLEVVSQHPKYSLLVLANKIEERVVNLAFKNGAQSDRLDVYEAARFLVNQSVMPSEFVEFVDNYFATISKIAIEVSVVVEPGLFEKLVKLSTQLMKLLPHEN